MTTTTNAPPRIPVPPDVEDGGGGRDYAWKARQRLASVLSDHVLAQVPAGRERALRLAFAALDTRIAVDRWADEHQVGTAALNALVDELEAITIGGQATAWR